MSSPTTPGGRTKALNVYSHLRRVGRREPNGSTNTQKMRKPMKRCTVHPTDSGMDMARLFHPLPTTQLIMVETNAPPWNTGLTISQASKEAIWRRLTADGCPQAGTDTASEDGPVVSIHAEARTKYNRVADMVVRCSARVERHAHPSYGCGDPDADRRLPPRQPTVHQTGSECPVIRNRYMRVCNTE